MISIFLATLFWDLSGPGLWIAPRRLRHDAEANGTAMVDPQKVWWKMEATLQKFPSMGCIVYRNIMKYPSDCDVHWRLLGPRGLPHFSELNSKSFWWSPIDHTSLGINCVIIHLLRASACFWSARWLSGDADLLGSFGAPHRRADTFGSLKEPSTDDRALTQMLKSQTVMMNDVVFRNLQRRAGTTSMEYFHGLLRSEIRRWVKRRVLTSRTSNADHWGVWKEIESTSADLHNCLTFQQTIRVVKKSVSKNSILG